MSTGLWVFLCVLLFVVGEIAGMFIFALLTANEEGDNGNKQ